MFFFHFFGCAVELENLVSTLNTILCVAVVALNLALLLLCFITFIAVYCPVAFVNS